MSDPTRPRYFVERGAQVVELLDASHVYVVPHEGDAMQVGCDLDDRVRVSPVDGTLAVLPESANYVRLVNREPKSQRHDRMVQSLLEKAERQEPIRTPDLTNVHNLLIRATQETGRARTAALQRAVDALEQLL